MNYNTVNKSVSGKESKQYVTNILKIQISVITLEKDNMMRMIMMSKYNHPKNLLELDIFWWLLI